MVCVHGSCRIISCCVMGSFGIIFPRLRYSPDLHGWKVGICLIMFTTESSQSAFRSAPNSSSYMAGATSSLHLFFTLLTQESAAKPMKSSSCMWGRPKDTWMLSSITTVAGHCRSTHLYYVLWLRLVLTEYLNPPWIKLIKSTSTIL